MSQDAELEAPFTLSYAYKRSTGPVLGRFLTALRDGHLEGVRAADGSVLFPACEADPRTGEATGEPVAVGPEGTVTAWTWVHHPREAHPLDQPFAFVMVQLDGASVPFLHVAKGAEAAMRTGMRVRPVWRTERVGSMLDVAWFEEAP